MHKIVISDTSCLIILDKIGYLSLLQSLYDTIVITPEVKNHNLRVLRSYIIF